MFNSERFAQTLESTTQMLKVLGKTIGYHRFGTLACDVVMNRRNAPKDFVETIGKAGEEANASNHARLRFQQILDRDLAASLQDLRKQYASASGGLQFANWRSAYFRFIIANGGSVGLNWYISTLSPSNSISVLIPTADGTRQFTQITERLLAHSRLRLSGPTRLFEISEQENGNWPTTVRAPTPELALARLAILMGEEPEKYRSVREVHDTNEAQSAAQALIAQANSSSSAA